MPKPTWSMTKIQPNPGQAHIPHRSPPLNTNSTSTKCQASSKWAIKDTTKVCRWATIPKDTAP